MPYLNRRSVPTGGAPQLLSELMLRQQALDFIQAYPDIYGMAYAAAWQIIHKHTGKSMDPSKVFWHRFRRANSSSKSFTGWEHVGAPIESMTLIELVMHRFLATDQDVADELNVNCGFYLGGPAQSIYNETNEVPMLPSAVMADFWELDFAAGCQTQVDAFWRDHGANFTAFAKARMLAMAGQALSRRQMGKEDFQFVLNAVTGDSRVDITWSTLTERKTPPPGLEIQRLRLGQSDSRSMLLIRSGIGRQVLYWPGAQPTFHCFENEPALYRWLQAQIADPMSRAALVAQFFRNQAPSGEFEKQLLQYSSQAWHPDQQLITQATDSDADVFEQLRDKAREEMQEDMRLQLTTSSSLRKQMWIIALGSFIKIVGGLAPLAWPLTLAVVGACAASIGLYIDQAINGRTPQMRHAGVVGAFLNTIYLFLNLPLLASIGHLPRAPRPILEVETEEPAVIESLEGLEGNETLNGLTPENGRSRGVHILPNGENWISLNSLPYRVRYLDDVKTWAVVDPDNPFAFNDVHPVRLNAEGQWEQVALPKLLGGAPMEGAGEVPGASSGPSYATTHSSFWDIYMQLNAEEEQRLSELADVRQDTVIDIYEAKPDEEVTGDANGDDILIDHHGESHRVFRTSTNVYYGGTIGLYTHDGDAYNVFLRSGQRLIEEQVEMVGRLADDLAEIEYNNDVTLYRGGSGERGTSGKVFREGKFKVGDVLVNTDFTSFSENPYIARTFSSSQGSESWQPGVDPVTFDDTSVVFELPAKEYLSAKPISLFSNSVNEAESLFMPGCYFQIKRIEEVTGANYRFMNVEMREIPAEQAIGAVFDMRTGKAFSRDQYAAMLGDDAKGLIDAFFPPKVE